VQKTGNRVRINTQLIDATTGGHMWAERYDRELHDLFALQDEVTQEITRALRVEVQAAEREHVRRIPTANLTAYDAWLRGVEYWWRFTNDDNDQARQLFERAIELDPQYADAYAWLDWTYWLEWGWKVDSHLFERAGELAQHALTLDDALPDAHMLLGQVYLWQKKQPEQAISEGERAIALDPNHALAYVMLAEFLSHAGRAEEAIGLVQQAMRLNPRYPFYYPLQLGVAYNLTGQNDEAIGVLQEALRLNPKDPDSYLVLAFCYLRQWIGQWSQDPQTLERAVEAAQQGVALSDSVDWTHGALSVFYLWQKQHEKAMAEAERSVALNPTEAQNQTYLGNVLNFMGRPDSTLERMEQVNCPTAFFDPVRCFSILGDAYYLTRQYEKAIGAFQQALRHPPLRDLGLFTHLGLAASYSELGREEEAQAEVAEILKINPQYSLAGMRQRWPYKDPAMLERQLAALRKAGLK
jgi:tetratricopeptide (TPR) repeat protein